MPYYGGFFSVFFAPGFINWACVFSGRGQFSPGVIDERVFFLTAFFSMANYRGGGVYFLCAFLLGSLVPGVLFLQNLLPGVFFRGV